jgi:DNA-binding response OmpR family regulator
MQTALNNYHRIPKILWLEDNPRMVELFQGEFETEFGVRQVGSWSALKGLPIGELQELDAVLLDMELPEGKIGLQAIQHLKEIGLRTPVLVLSNDESLQSRLEMLSNGADDYLWKAMDPEEMLIRIRNAISRYKTNKKEIEPSLCSLEIFPKALEARLHGAVIELSKIEFQMMSLLVRRHPCSVSLEQLKNEVWKLPNIECGTINTFIWKLNKKLSSWEYRIAKLGDTVALHSKSIE